jgi:hypothetical protein
MEENAFKERRRVYCNLNDVGYFAGNPVECFCQLIHAVNCRSLLHLFTPSQYDKNTIMHYSSEIVVTKFVSTFVCILNPHIALTV